MNPAILDRYAKRNGNFVLVRSQKPEARSQNRYVELIPSRDPKTA
jgi:hypothetical protein